MKVSHMMLLVSMTSAHKLLANDLWDTTVENMEVKEYTKSTPNEYVPKRELPKHAFAMADQILAEEAKQTKQLKELAHQNLIQKDQQEMAMEVQRFHYTLNQFSYDNAMKLGQKI